MWQQPKSPIYTCTQTKKIKLKKCNKKPSDWALEHIAFLFNSYSTNYRLNIVFCYHKTCHSFIYLFISEDGH